MRILGTDAHLARATRLRNGLTVWLRPHSEPRRSLAMGLVVEAGSLGEAEAERGLSHLIEHLAFCGGRRMTRAALARFQEQLGIRLGHEQNAFTSFDRTCYSLKLRDVGREGIEAGLAWLADVASALRLAPDDIDAERQVILEEMRVRDSVSSRLHRHVLAQLAPLLHERDPLGEPAALRTLTPLQIRASYERWYVPCRTTLVLVGDFPAGEMLRLVRRAFADWQGSSDGQDTRATLPRLTGCRVMRVFDPEVERAQVRVLGLGRSRAPQSRDELARVLASEAALWLAAYRLSDSFPAAHTSVTPLVGGWRAVETAVSAPADNLEICMSGLASALAEATMAPVTPVELSLTRRHLLARGRSMETAPSGVALFDELLALATHDQPPPLSGAVVAREAVRLGRSLTRTQLSGRLTALAPSRGAVVFLVAPGEERARLDPQLARVFQRKLSSVRPVRRRARPPRPLAVLPKAQRDASRRSWDRRHGVLDLDLANGACAHVMPLHGQPRLVHVAVSLAGGRIEETRATLGLTAAATLAFARPTTQSREAREIRDLLTVRSVSLGCHVDEDVVTLEIVSGPQDLEWALTLLHELLREPRVDKETLRHWRERIEALEATRRPSVEHVLATETLRLLTGDDPRFRLISAARAREIDRGAAQRWLRDHMRAAPIEAALVGVAGRARAAELAERCFGGLSARPPENGHLQALRRLDIAAGPLESEDGLPGPRDRAAALVGWRAAAWDNTEARMLLQIASEVLSLRLHTEVRERRGLVYDISSSYSPSRAYPQASLLSASFVSNPRSLREAARVAREVAERLAHEGPTGEELEAAQKRLHALALEARRERRFWARTLAEQRMRHRLLHEIHDLPAMLLGASREEVRAALARFVVASGRLSVLCNAAAKPPTRRRSR